MAYEVDYSGDNSRRRALNDLIKWLGLKRSKIAIRGVRSCRTFGDLDRMDFYLSMAGVSGAPVRALYAHVHGEAILDAWSKSPEGDNTPFSEVTVQ